MMNVKGEKEQHFEGEMCFHEPYGKSFLEVLPEDSDIVSLCSSLTPYEVRGKILHFYSFEGVSPLQQLFPVSEWGTADEVLQSSEGLFSVLHMLSLSLKHIRSTRDQMYSYGHESDVFKALPGFLKVLRQYYRDNAFVQYLCDSLEVQINTDSDQKVLFDKLSDTNPLSKERERIFDQIVATSKKPMTEVVDATTNSIQRSLYTDPFVNPLQNEELEVAWFMEMLKQDEGFQQSLEEDLGIDIRRVGSLVIQVQLLRFLSTQSREQVQRLGTLLQSKSEEDQIIILHGFLSCALDIEDGESVIDILEAEEGADVLVLYSKFLDLYQKIGRKCEYIFSEKSALGTVLRSFLRRGQSVLRGSEYSFSEPFKESVLELGGFLRLGKEWFEQETASPDNSELFASFSCERISGDALPEDVIDFLSSEMRAVHSHSPGCVHFWEQEIVEMQTADFFFMVLRDNEGNIIGINGGSLEVSDGSIRVGKLYVRESYRKDFSVGQLLFYLREQELPSHEMKISASAFKNPVWLLHLQHGWYVKDIQIFLEETRDALLSIEKGRGCREVEKKKCSNEDELFSFFQTLSQKGLVVMGVVPSTGGQISQNIEDIFPCEVIVGVFD